METTTSEQLWGEINNLKKRLEMVERQAAQLKPSEELSAEEEFRREFPGSKIDRKLFDLVGTDPHISLDEERAELIRVLTQAKESDEDIS